MTSAISATHQERIVYRSKIAAWILAGCLCGLIGRLFWVQVLGHTHYRDQGRQQHWVRHEISARRGEIRDRHGTLLAVSQEAASCYANPQEIKNPPETAKKLAPILEMEYELLLKRLTHPTRRFTWLKRLIPPAIGVAIGKLKLPGVFVQTEPRRVYPHGTLAAHALGFVGLDQIGLEGVEASFNPELSGVDGFRWALKDGRLAKVGIYYPYAPEQLPKDGATLYLSLNISLQHILESEMDKLLKEYPAVGASGLVLEVASGEILAMTSRPTYDPNEFARYDPKSWRNMSISDAYEQGSVMKPFIVAAALAEKEVTPETPIFCHNGVCRIIPGRILHDSHPYGTLTVAEVVIKSSNIGTALIGMKLGSQRLCRYLELIGFGQKTNVVLPGETTGILKQADDWTDFTLTSVPMGHEVCVTPLQMAAAYAMLAGDGIYRPPSLVSKIVHADGNVWHRYQPAQLTRVYPKETVAELRQMLRLVVEEGTAKKANTKTVSIAGKTGTAQKLDSSGHYSHEKFIAVFVGFAPAEEPRYCCLVLVDEPQGAYYGGTVAAPTAGRILQQICLQKNVTEGR